MPAIEAAAPVTADVPASRGEQVQVGPTQPPPETAPTYIIPHYGEWLRLAECESNSTWDINTGNGFYGGLQFTQTSWEAVGGGFFAQRADLAKPEEQMVAAEALLDIQGWGAWPACSRKLGLR